MNLSRIKTLTLIIVLQCTINLFASDLSKPYAVNNIPHSLLLNANAVVRTDQMIQTIDDIHQSKISVKRALTLLNEKASDQRFVYIYHDEFIKVSNIKANVYNSNGELLTSVRPYIRDLSGNFGDLANDSRYWLISFPIRKYPFTIEFEYEQTNTGSFIFDSWSFQNEPDISVEQSGVQISIKKGIGFRVYEKNLKHSCDTFSNNDHRLYTWQEENIPAQKAEELFLVSFDQKIPYIRPAPNEFSMGGIDGSMESWESLGRYFYDLNKNRDQISPELQSRLKSMISNTTDKKEMINIVFKYLQKNTRYISIQLGIGGNQTMEASFVEKKGYGDCKALSNYMKSMLKSVGIPSYLTLISSGKNEDIITSFPSDQFNHVILCVPLEKDTVWLECTSQTIPFNFLGSSNSNKHVLLLTENGGKLVKTPNYKSRNNRVSSKYTVSIDMGGSATIKGERKYEGVSYEEPYYVLNSTKKNREDYINNLFACPNITIDKIKYTEDIQGIPYLTMECDLVARDFVSKTKKRMVFNPYLFDPAPYNPKFYNQDFKVISSKTVSDTIVYSFPYGYKPEHIPSPVNIESKYGKFNYKCELNQGKLEVTRRFEYYENTYDQKEMDAFVEFVNNIAASERQLVLLLKE